MALTPRERKALSRNNARSKGLVRVKFQEIWTSPAKAKQIEIETAKLIAKTLAPSD